MKKLALMAILLSLALVGCGEKKVEEVKDAATQTVEQAKEATTEAAAEVKETAEKAVEEVKDAATQATEQVKDAVAGAVAEVKEAVAQALKFKDTNGTEYSLDITGENAILKTSTGEEYALKLDTSASGSRFADDKGNEIHFKGEAGVVKLNGKETNLELVK